MEKKDIIRIMVEEGMDELKAAEMLEALPPGVSPDFMFTWSEEGIRERARETLSIAESLKFMTGGVNIMAMKKHNEMGRKPEDSPDSTRIKLTGNISFDAHLCEDCRIAGHCSMEPLARYFKDHPDDVREYRAEINRLLSGDWKKVVEADSVILSPGGVVDKLLSLAFGTGYVFAKGQKINNMTMTREIAAEANASASIAAMMLDIGR